MSGVAVAIGVSAVAGAIISADASRKAAHAQQDAISQGRIITAQTAEQAKTDLLNTITPALSSYGREMKRIENMIADGTADVIGVLQNTSDNVQQLLTDAGADARKAILGSSASAKGVSRDIFDSSYNNISNLPPDQQVQAFDNMASVITNRPQRAPGLGTVEPQPASGTTVNMQQTPSGTFEAQPEYGFTAADRRLVEGQQQGLSTLNRTNQVARNDIITGRDASLQAIATGRTEALNRLQPYSEVGQQALQQEAALSGALGPEAQQAAINAFIESPGQKYLREQEEKALIRNSAAIGGLGGGRVRSALMEQAMGIAATQQQQQLENYRSLATRGQEADTNAASIWGSTSSQEAGINTAAATQLAQLAEALGVNSTELISMTASQRANLAQSTGLSLAQLDQAIATAKAGALGSFGTAIAGTKAGSLSDIANLRETAATNKLQTRANLGQALGNLGVGAGSSMTALTLNEGSALANNAISTGNAWAQALQGLGTAAAYSLGNNATVNTSNSMPIQMKQQLGLA